MAARINIESDLFTRNEWTDLVIHFKDRAKALGELNWAWITAQQFWFPDRNPIPHDVWKLQRLNDALIDCGFAEKREDGVYMKGSEAQFSWLFQKQESGRKGGEASAKKRAEQNTTDVISISSDAQADSSAAQAPLDDAQVDSSAVKQIQPSYSFSSSYSSSEELNLKNLKANSRKRAPPPPGMGRFIATYATAWKARWKSRPDLRGKVQGQIKTFLADCPIDRACELIQVYCQMEEPFFVTKCHDFGTFLENIGKVNIALDTGQLPGTTDPFAFFKNDLAVVK